MYYIYTIEGGGKVYVGCTINPTQRLADHKRKISNYSVQYCIDMELPVVMALRYQTNDRYEARDIETRLIREMNSCNYSKQGELARECKASVLLWKPIRWKKKRKYYVRISKDRLWYNVHKVKGECVKGFFRSRNEAEVFIESL